MASDTVAGKIADVSPDEDTWKKNLVAHAKQIHGNDVVQVIGDKSNDEFDFITQIKDLVNGPIKQPETLESKYLEPYVYPTLRELDAATGAMALPIQYATAPIGQAVNATSNLIQGKPLEESANPITEPFKYAHQFGTTSALMRTLPVGNQPIAQMLPETDAGNYMRKEFPKASDYARYVSPNDIASMGADIGLAKKIPTPEVKVNQPMSLETAADYVRSLATNKKQLLELEASGKVYDLAKMVQLDPESYLHPFRPNKIYENIEGKISPETASRDRSTGLLNQAMEKQNQFIEGLPRNEYSIPREEIQREALNNLNKAGQLESGQRVSAENIIKSNIPIEQPDPAKVERIKKASSAQDKLQGMGKDISSERMILQAQIQAQKNALISAVNAQPDLIHNPKFREDLQWLSSIPVMGMEDAPNVYPKQRFTTEGSITKPPSNFTTNLPGKENIPFSSTQEYNPTVTSTGGVTNQKLMDIAQGAQKEPAMTSNPGKSQALGDAVEKLRALNDDLKNLAEKPVSAVNNKNLLAKMAERNKLQQFVKENYDPSAPSVEMYTDMIRKRNEEPSGYASNLRRLGNKLQEPLAPGEVSTDIGAKNLAGRAIEQAGKNAQDTIMSSSNVPWQDVARYQDTNKDISNMINMKGLTQGNFVSDSASGSEFVPGGVTGKSGLASYVAKTKDRFVKPIGAPIMNSAINAVKVAGSTVPKMAAINAPMANTFKSPLPMQLVEYQIPRDSNQILQNKDVVIAKIAQMSNNPVMTDMFKDAIEKHPEKLSKVLPALVMQFPDLFESDDYNRVDGKIFDPTLKQKALKDIQNDRNMNIREKAFKSKRLQEEGILE